MLKPLRLTTTLSLTFLTLITGCSSQSNSTQPLAKPTETATLPEVKKLDLPKIVSPDYPNSPIHINMGKVKVNRIIKPYLN